MLHFLLRQAHLEARLVELPGHVLNEVKINGIGFVVFPFLALNPAHQQSYRPLAGSFRQFMLARVAVGFHVPVSYSETFRTIFDKRVDRLAHRRGPTGAARGPGDPGCALPPRAG
jgi:hypothetical protein